MCLFNRVDRLFVYPFNYSLVPSQINMENGLESTGDSRLDQAVTQWLQYDKVRPNICCCVASSSFKYVKSDIFSVETEIQ